MNILKIFTSRRIIGNIGEDAAARFLKKKGCKILERNYVAAGHEIDIIAEEKNHVLFVEVKTRTEGKTNSKEPRPASSVNYEKRQSIIKTARLYFPTLMTKKRMRFDVIEVYLDKDSKVTKIEHLTDAFRGDTGYTR